MANLQIQRLLVTGMFACGAWTLARALMTAGLTTAHALAIFLVATGIFAAGAALSGRETGRSYRRYTDYGLTDWALLLVPIVLFLKLLPRLLEGPAAVAQEVASWMDNPWTFWDAGLVWGLILVFFVWDLSLQVGENLGRLAFQPGEAPPRTDSPAFQEWASTPYRFVDHTAAWRFLMRLFVAGGCLVLLFTGLALVPPDELGNPERPEVQGVMPVVLLYYLLGLIFASQTSLDRLRASWLRGGVAIQPGLAQRWLAYSVALMTLGLALALLLPTSFSEQAADQLPGIWRWLWFIRLPLGLFFRALEWIFGGLAALLFAPLTWLLPDQAPGGQPATGPPAEGPRADPPVASQPRGDPTLGSRLVWSILLYVVPSALALYAIWNVWRKRREIWRDMRGFWRDVFQLIRDAALDLAAALWRLFSFGSPRLLNLAPPQIRARLRRRRAGGGEAGPMRWLRLRGLGPRELIQYFYVSLVQRAEGVGWPRKKGQTPYEYSRDLAERLPDRRPELQTLTDAFVRAKYSPQPVAESDARSARGPWERLRGALQTRRRTRQIGSWFGFGRD
ncbi:MAG: DUF4129 domain-containing protein [Chloroflexota bacterium]